MSAYWKERVFDILDGLDCDKFTSELDESLRRHLRSGSLQRVVIAFFAVIIVMNMLCPDNAFAKGYHGSHYRGGTHAAASAARINLFGSVAATAFCSNYWLQQAYVPDMQGKAHPRLSFVVESYTEVSPQPLKAFFALNDNTYITEQGDIFQLIPRTSFLYKVETDRLTLYKSGSESPIIDLALDNELAEQLYTDIEVHRKILAVTITRLEKWLNWAAGAEVVAKDIGDEKKELEKLKVLQKVLAKLYKNNYAASSVGLPEGASLRLAPSVRLTMEGGESVTDSGLIAETSDGIWKNYIFRSFKASVSREAMQQDSRLDVFFEELLKAAISNLKPHDPMRGLVSEKMGLL